MIENTHKITLWGGIFDGGVIEITEDKPTIFVKGEYVYTKINGRYEYDAFLIPLCGGPQDNETYHINKQYPHSFGAGPGRYVRKNHHYEYIDDKTLNSHQNETPTNE